MDLKDLTLEEKIGQMVMLGMDTNYITENMKTMITEYKIGGVLLYRKKSTTYQDMLKLIADLKELNKNNKVPLFIAIDQEGGRVNRFPNEIENLPPASKLAASNDVSIVTKSTKITSKSLGFNLNFAPVLDIQRFDDNHAIGNRCYGKNKADVVKFAISAMKEFQKQGIVPVVKHFPGHGTTNIDSHFFLPITNSKMQDLENEDVFPFLQAIKDGADALLVSHILLRKEAGIFPSSLSRKIIVKYLRKKYRFRGLIITDSLKMSAIKLIYGQARSVKRAFYVGNDIILFRFNPKTEKKALDKVLKATKNGKIRERQINRSVNRILKIKEKYNISDETMPDKINIEKVNVEIEEIRKKVHI